MKITERITCKNQQEFFELMSKKCMDMYTFIPDFLQSDFCNRELDADYSVFQCSDVEDWLDFLKKEISLTPNPLAKKKISPKVAGWLGFTYRQIQVETKMKSSEIIQKIPLQNMVQAYAGLHTVDEDMAFEIIKNDFRI